MNNQKCDPITSIDKLIHSPARLSIMTNLYVVDSGDAVFLANQTKLTWGNLSTHLSKLESAGYIAIEKTFEHKKPKTIITLTDKGRNAFDAYRKTMTSFLSSTDI
jgi:DNA-binding MarR family transcriptional regulator